jgi:predicted CoA-binding protein
MSKKTLIIGASLKSNRYSNIVMTRLVANGHEVKAIGIKEGEVGGIKIETSMPNYIGIDTVSLYLNPIRQIAYYNYIISLKPKRVIFNPGTENMQLIELLKKSNIEAEIACNLVLLAVNQY